MLNKRFKIAKCKTSLKLATSRIKLMRNKKGVQINQMKKELAQLLESGQDRTARIRVEHVIREEKMIAAYDLIEIYCELIVARLPIIESQKTCPIDLKEAVTSVIFAAPRCSDIPELLDARKNFTSKYGKEFVSAAIELRPDCGVSRMLVEKLSAVAPDVQTKVKVLSGVAKEYNINWEPTSFEEKELKPPQDLLNGATNFEYASTINVDSPKIQSSNIHNVHNNPNVSPDFQQQNKRFTLDAQNISVKDNGSNQTSFSSTTSLSGMSSGMMNTRQSFNSNQTDSWNMEFKDATSAAQAAAESAERASIAARAAAQLSRQYSTESQVKPPELTGQLNNRNPKKQNQQRGPTEINNNDDNYNDNDYDNSPISSQRLSSLRSRNDQDRYSRETSLSKELKGRFQSGGNQSSFSSSRSDDVLTFDQQIASQTTVVDQGNRYDETRKTSSYSNASRDDVLTFDQQKVGQTTSIDQETDSDDDDGPGFDMGFEYDEQEAKSFFPSPGRESIPPLENPTFKNDPRNKTDHTNRAKPVDRLVKTDLSGGPDSESESEMVKSSFNLTNQKSRKLNDLIEKRSSSFHNREKDDKTKIPQPQKSSRVPQPLTDNSELTDDSDLEDGNELKFPALLGGLQNKGGLKYPLSTNTAVTDGSTSFKKPVNEIPVKVDSTSKPSRLYNRKPIVSSSESDSDDDTFSVQSSKSRSQFAPPDLFFKNDGIDSEEEVVPIPKRTSASKVHSGSGSVTGLSRRTKGQVEPRGKTVISSQSPPKPRPRITPSKQEPSRTLPEPKISEQEASPRKKIVESGKPKSSNLGPEASPEANNVKKPSHVHPKLPEYDSLAARIQALQSSRK